MNDSTNQPINQLTNHGEMAELAEGARLLSEYGGKLPSRVRIPVSPPFYKNKAQGITLGFIFIKKVTALITRFCYADLVRLGLIKNHSPAKNPTKQLKLSWKSLKQPLDQVEMS